MKRVIIAFIFIMVAAGVILPAFLRPGDERILESSLARDGRKPEEGVYYVIDHDKKRITVVRKKP